MNMFAEKLKSLRIENNLSIRKLSELTGISSSSLSRYENGQADVPSEVIVILSKFFNVSADYLLGLED